MEARVNALELSRDSGVIIEDTAAAPLTIDTWTTAL
jgi:hypothetical protein